ncbi:MAG: efflux RND transporter periplasmic adaptor subunit [Hymenobacteraceae bacterium]|nr:efflux RND transporter periplasmic adaptor subunit [Hymenobacteraceae bacterium]
MNNRLIYILVGLIVVLLGGVMFAKSKGWLGAPTGISVMAEPVAYARIAEKVSASGKVQPVTEVKLAADVSGEITELFVKEGDSVTKGQLLARIRPDAYQSAVAMQSAGVSQQQANLAQSRAALGQTEATAAQTRLTWERSQKLYEQKVIAQAEFEQSRAQYQASLKEVESARQRIRASEAGVSSANASLSESRTNLNRTTLYAPVAGIVSKLAVERGERVVGTGQMGGTEMLRIANLRAMEVRVNVNENDIVRVRLGDSVIIDVDAYATQNRKFKGIVTSIANSAKDATTLDAVTEFEVRILLLNESYRDLLAKSSHAAPFRPGMTASVDIITDRKDRALAVPLTAVTTRTPDQIAGRKPTPKDPTRPKTGTDDADAARAKEELKEIVFVVDNGEVKAVEVKTGISDFDHIEITSGLKEGQKVVSGPFRAVSKTLKPKDKVVVKTAEEIANELKGNGPPKEEGEGG